MRVFEQIKNYEGLTPVVLSIGNFDGLHLGHQYLLQKNMELAAHLKARSVLLSFTPHPLQVIRPELVRVPILSPREQELGLEKLGIDDWIKEPFTSQTSQESARSFIERILKSVPVIAIVVGPDFRFGKNREGDTDLLQVLSKDQTLWKLHSEVSDTSEASEIPEEPDTIVKTFQVVLPEPYFVLGQRVSSSLVREALLKGEVDRAHTLLGRSFTLSGKVVSGFRRGRTIGFPTANILSLQAHHLRRGVYLTFATIHGERRKSVTNIGVHPTFEEDKELQVETHILDFSENIYGDELKLEFITFLRPEVKFKDIEALKTQIAKDVQFVRQS